MTEMILKSVQARKTFPSVGGDVVAVAEVDLKVKSSEFVGLYGPSGCGKSTFLLMAGGLMEPTSGEILVAGQNIYQMDASYRSGFRAENIGFLFQQFHLIPYLNVLENVLTPALAGNVDNAEDKARELLKHFSLDHRLTHVPSKLSTGEQQRVALVRALLRSPKLLLADEPTGNLDTDNSKTVLDFLDEFAKSGGAVVMATHDPAALERTTRSISLKN
jgi:putative ABC transport system ATP-binding protein